MNKLVFGLLLCINLIFTSHGAAGRENCVFDATSMIIPKPVSQHITEGYFTLSPATNVVCEGDVDLDIARYAEEILFRAYPRKLTYSLPVEPNFITLVQDPTISLPEEGYRFKVEPDKITISAPQRAGIFYGLQTLMQLFPPEIYGGAGFPDRWPVVCQEITDYPAFGYRGQMLDVARTFSDKNTVLRFIDRLAYHKINNFHWHLTDDEGWRIEIKAYPELAELGGFRGGDSPVKPIYGAWDRKYGGYFTQEEIKEVVAYAAFRNITVIPEIDLPGHSRATAKVYPEILCAYTPNISASGDDRRDAWCASREANYKMLETILDEICELFPSEYIYIGGDEVAYGQWKACPDCRRLMAEKGYSEPKRLLDHFTARLVEILKKKGRKAAVWNEAAESGTLDKTSRIYAWEGVKQAKAVTAKGYQTVLKPGSYFYIDMKQSPDEDGMTWAGIVTTERLYSFNLAEQGFTAEQIRNIEGVQAAFFSELYLSHDYHYLDYQTYPRICALSEVGWTDEKARDWDDFYYRLTASHLARLDAMGVQFRMCEPEVNYSPGRITASAPFAGSEIRYTIDGTEPTAESTLYTQPMLDHDPGKYLFRAFYLGHASGPVVPSPKYRSTIGPGESRNFEMDLSKMIDSDGLWYLRMRASDANMRLNKVSVSTAGSSYNIVGAQRFSETHLIRFYANSRNREGKMTISLKNYNNYPCDVMFELQPSPYIEPKVSFTSSLTENSRFPFSNLTDYNFSSYSRTTTTCKKGDHFTYTFTEPVDARSIEVVTGLSYMPRYHIIDGRVQTSIDGRNFTDAARLEAGKAIIYPDGPLKAVRIVSDMDGNSEGAVALQDLKIKPGKR